MQDEEIVVRLWDDSSEDASAEGTLRLTHAGEGGPLYAGAVVTKEGKVIWVTVN